MKEVIISENVGGIVNARKIISNISAVEERLNNSKNKADGLISKIDSSKKSIELVSKGDKGRTWYTFNSLNKEVLLELIVESNSATQETVYSISDLLKSNNENVKDLSEMIRALAMLSGLSFEKISETTAELDALIDQLNESSQGTNTQGKHISRIIVAQIEKLKADKEEKNKVEYNFSIINENIKEIDKRTRSDRNELRSEIKKIESRIKSDGNKTVNEIKEIKNLITNTSENQQYKKLEACKNKINQLTILLATNFIITISAIIYFSLNYL